MRPLALLAAALLLPVTALAEDRPWLSVEGYAEIENDWAYDSDDADAEHNDLYATVEVAPTLAFAAGWSLSGTFVFEPVQDFNPGEDGFFDNEGLYMEELFLAYGADTWGVRAGKINPAFGALWDADGIWVGDFAEDYELTEKIGAGAHYTLAGAHTLSAAAFFADTSTLSDSAFTRRGQVRQADGGASNTGDPSSFVVSLTGAKMEALPGLSYGLYVRHLAQGDADVGPEFDEEQGLAANLGYAWAATERLGLSVMGEVAHLDHFGGGADDHTYAGAVVMATWDARWSLALGHTTRWVDRAGGGDDDDHLTQASVGYAWPCGLYTHAGWRGAREGGVDTHSLGGVFGYAFAF
ncbi:MAG TPA: hypothetical protein DDX54_01540 [Rhodospirillaceae bacterium]|nr:hypothetical protein [Alphaproteobacteria bacterium]HBH26074.1 hypothetical protein [Rhodospirillaceae bacterium]